MFSLPIVIIVGLVMGMLGVMVGRSQANADWIVSAREDLPNYRTAHYCEGKFYYVIPEPEFVRDWMRTELLWQVQVRS